MKNINLKEIDGKRFRRQYFTFIIYIILSFMIFLPYCMTVSKLIYCDFDSSMILYDVLTTVIVCFIAQLPFIVLAILNRFCFGKIICVANEQGIYHKNGFVAWKDITRIEYEFQSPTKYRMYPSYAFIYTNDEDKTVQITHAPMYLLKYAKRIKPNIETKITKDSKRSLLIFTLIMVIAVPLIMLLDNN